MVWQQPPSYLHTQDELPPKAKDIFFGVTTCQVIPHITKQKHTRFQPCC